MRPDGCWLCVGQTPDIERTLPLVTATALWLAGAPRREPGQFVVLSFALTPETPRTLRIIVHHGKNPHHPPPPPVWPVWHPLRPPQWRQCPVGRWVGLPNTDEGCNEAVQHSERVHATAQREAANGIQGRCDSIVQQGEDPDFQETLDYYTTMRVKLACLRMNTQGLVERLELVRVRIASLLCVLRSAAPEYCQDWMPPETPVGSPPVDTTTTDPNALCVPQAEDYELPPTDDDDDFASLVRECTSIAGGGGA